MSKFNVGDYIIGNLDNTYSQTCKGSYWYVTKICPNEIIFVNKTEIHDINGFKVESKYFDIVKSSIPGSFELLESGDYIIK